MTFFHVDSLIDNFRLLRFKQSIEWLRCELMKVTICFTSVTSTAVATSTSGPAPQSPLARADQHRSRNQRERTSTAVATGTSGPAPQSPLVQADLHRSRHWRERTSTAVATARADQHRTRLRRERTMLTGNEFALRKIHCNIHSF